jgi:hypothetical protein
MGELLIVIVEGPGAGREANLTGSVTVGRDPGAGLVVDDPEASREHASITPRDDGAVIDDLGSTNGTFVNDVRIGTSQEVVIGDRIRIGTTVMELRPVTALAGAGAGAPGAEGAAAQPSPPAGAPGPEQPAAAGVPEAAAATPAPYYGPPSGGYPIDLEADYPEEGIANWRPLVQWILAIPHHIILFFLVIAAFIAWFPVAIAIIATGRYPRALFAFVAGTFRWYGRVAAYTYFMNDRYPPFDLAEHAEYPLRLQLTYPEEGIERWRPLVHWLLVIPQLIVLYAIQIVGSLLVFAAWFVVTFTRRWPQGIWDIVVGWFRYQTRVYAYVWLMTGRYPPFTLSS